MLKKTVVVLVLISFLFVTACKKQFDIDVSNVKIDLKIIRFDTIFSKLNTLDTSKIVYETIRIQKQYRDFFDLYTTQLLGLGNPQSKQFYTNLSDFFVYCDEQDLFGQVSTKFPINDSWLQNQLSEAFKHYRYYFNDDSIPVVYTCVSGYNVSVFTSHKIIGISLDKYLGKDYKPYYQIFDKYLVRRMSKEYIPVDVMKAYAMQRFPYNDSLNTLMSRMIYEGRLQYFLDAILPDVADTTKWGYTQLQWKWANKFEKKIWEYLVDQKLLFSTKQMEIKTFTDEAPFTTPFTQYSPPRTGNFVGYKIVRSFMSNNKNVSLQELMQIRDYMYIYNNSYYRP